MQTEYLANETPMISEQYARRVYCSSMIAIVSVFVSFHFQLYNFTFLAALVLFSSINYWRDPVAGWRRTLDMTCVFIACAYQMVASFGLHSEPYFVAYWLNLAVAAFAYMMARRHGRKYADCDKASRWHVTLHLFGNISNVLLYYGFSLQ